MGSFLGAWRVREYVFDADGTYRGQVVQRRQLFLRHDTRVRVMQDCKLDRALLRHPIAAFGGHHEFDLVASGSTRRFLGPAVIGAGVQIQVGDISTTLGRGHWPALGYSFTSYVVLNHQQRQLTGGRFFVGARTIAELVGVAEPEPRAGPRAGEGAPTHYPKLRGPIEPVAIARAWAGERVRRDAYGNCEQLGRVERTYTREAGGYVWRELLEDGSTRRAFITRPDPADEARVNLVIEGPESAPLLAAGSRSGWTLSVAGVRGPELVVEWTELLDPGAARLVIIQRRVVRHAVKDIEITNLRART